MFHITDQQLLNEIQRRLEENRRNMEALKQTSDELTTVNEKLMASEALKSDFLSNIRNEVNNPLTAILGLAENMFEEAEEPERVQEMARMIYKEAFSLDFQMRTIFAAAEIEAGEAQLHVAEIVLRPFIERIINSFAHAVAEKHLTVLIEPDLSVLERDRPFCSDPEKLHLVISHILSNAIEYSSPGSSVSMEFLMTESTLALAVQDEGVGIDKSDHDRIFDRFVQLDCGLTKMHRGHGLGLSVAKSAVEILGGEINVESELGKGSRFVVTVPVLDNSSDINIFALDGNEEMF